MMEEQSPFARVASVFRNRGQLVLGQPFVGRRRELQQAQGVCKPGSIQSLWISGPRQIGKSSLAARVPFVEETGGTRIDLSLGGGEWLGLDGLANAILGRLGETPSGFGALSNYIERRDRPVLVVIDEFDTVAVQLNKDEQASLRKLADKIPHFGWLFITRAQPTHLCEDFGEDNSRLVSICQSLRLGFLTETDVDRLVNHAEGMLRTMLLEGGVLPSGIGRWIYKRVGGYPVADQALLAEILLEADEREGILSLDQLDQPHVEGRFFGQALVDLQKLWRDLPSLVRHYVEHNGERISHNTETYGELVSLNLLPPGGKGGALIPRWLRRALPQAPQPTDKELGLFGPAERIHAALRICNSYSAQWLPHPIFSFEEEIYRLAGPVRNRPEFAGLIGYLCRLLLDPARSILSVVAPHVLVTIMASTGFQALNELEKTDAGIGLDYHWVSFPFRSALEITHPPMQPNEFIAIQQKLLELCALSVEELAGVLSAARSAPSS